jgi:hypothetical protein
MWHCQDLSPNNMAQNTLNVRPSLVLSLHADWCCLKLWYCHLTWQDTWKAASSLNTILAVDFEFWKFIRARCTVNFSVLGCYMLHWLIILNEFIEFYALLIVAGITVMHLVLLPFLHSKQKLLELHSFSNCSFTGVFAFTNATSFTGQLMALVDGYFCWHFPTKLHTRSPLHSNHWFRFLTLEHTLCFLHLGCYFPQRGDSTAGGKTWKLQ